MRPARIARIRSYTITVRSGAKVERKRFQELRDALAAIERRGRELEREADARAVGGRVMRRMEPVQQVTARIELSGPGRLRAGIDVRGDGSSESFTGRVKRRLVEQNQGESSYDALRRTLGDG
jgi:hypothetical protein